MRILVNNERERELLEEFIDFLSDYMDSKEMQNILEKSDYSFKGHEIDFLQAGVQRSSIEVDEKVWSTIISSDNLSGTCRYCNEQWQGIEDECEVNIYDYERFLSLEVDESHHAECLRENQCIDCGSDEDTENVEGEGALCEDCRGDRE